MFAPAHHPAMKNVAATRLELGTRTIFNLLGPLSNPAGVRRQMIGVFSNHWTKPLALVLKNLGAEKVWVVHGSDGLDEITTSGPTSVVALENGQISAFEISPEQFGLHKVKPEALRGGDAETNARAVLDVLKGKPSAFRDVALLNAAAALVVAGKAKDLKDGLHARGPFDRFRRGGRAARPLDQGIERGGELMSDILTKIGAYKREEIAAAKRAASARPPSKPKQRPRARRAASCRRSSAGSPPATMR